MMRWTLAIVAVLSLLVIGCGRRALGPVSEEQLKPADPTVVKQGVEESAKHLPPGAQIPPGVIPGSQPPAGQK